MNYRRESVVSDVTRTAEELPTIVAKLQTSTLWAQTDTLYPFSQVLRLRVLQVLVDIVPIPCIPIVVAIITDCAAVLKGRIWQKENITHRQLSLSSRPPMRVVCGISVLLMGSVSCIEDRATLTRLGLGIPAGVFTVLAAGASIHSSRGFGGYRPASCPYPALRFLGPSPATATSLTLLWLAACSLHFALICQALSVLRNMDYPRLTQTSILVAAVEMILSLTTLVAVLWVVKIDCCYDPD